MNSSTGDLPLQFSGSTGYRKHELTLTPRQLNMINKLEAAGKEYLNPKHNSNDGKVKSSARKCFRTRNYLPDSALDKELKENFTK